MRHFAIVLGFVALIAAVVGGAYWYSHRTEPVELVHVPIPAEAWAAYRRDVTATPRAAVTSDASVRAAWEALHVAEVEAARETAGPDAGTRPATPGTSVGIAAVEWERAARDAVQEAGPERFVDLGRRLGLDFVDAVQALLVFCGEARLETSRCLTTRGGEPTVSAYVRLGGLFVEFARRAGFTESGPQGERLVEARAPMLQAVFLDHWTRAVRTTHELEALLSPQEMAWLNRWKAEWQVDGHPDKRVAAALALRDEPGYPAELNAGVLRYTAGDFKAAAEHFARAPEPIAALYRRLADAAPQATRP